MKTATQILNDVQTLLVGRKFTGNTPAVRRRQRTEETIVLAAAVALIDAGYYLGVNDGEETTIHHSRDIAAIQKALFTTDEDYLYVYKLATGGKRPDSWVRCVYGNDGYDVISDYLRANRVLASRADLESVIGTGSVIGEIQVKAEEGCI